MTRLQIDTYQGMGLFDMIVGTRKSEIQRERQKTGKSLTESHVAVHRQNFSYVFALKTFQLIG